MYLFWRGISAGTIKKTQPYPGKGTKHNTHTYTSYTFINKTVRGHLIGSISIIRKQKTKQVMVDSIYHQSTAKIITIIQMN